MADATTPPPPSSLDHALALHRAGRFAEAEAIYRQLLATDPQNAELTHLLGATAHQQGRYADAIDLFSAAVALSPREPRYHNNLGEALRYAGRIEEAIAAYASAIRLRPNYAEALNNLSAARIARGRFAEAIEASSAALRARPDYVKALNTLGAALHKLGRNDEALAAFERSAALAQDNPATQASLAVALARRGDVEAALNAYRASLRLRPDHANTHGAMLFLLHYSDRLSPEEIFAEHQRWADRFAAPLTAKARFDNDRTPARRLRVGYVSPDFCSHPVGYFMRSLIAQHDPAAVEVFCYSGVQAPDAITDDFRRHARGWRDTAGMTDRQLAEQVRADRIDVLVDLALHMAGSRLLAFAHRPAPVQVTYLGYPHSTGLPQMDYRLTDLHLDPPGLSEQFHVEKLIRLPETWMACDPEPDAPAPGEPPALARGHVTFGSFNALMKVTSSVVAAWSRLLQRVPASRLLMRAAGLGSAGIQQRVRDLFAGHGVDAARLDLAELGSVRQCLTAMASVDLALDTFPFCGGTTSVNCAQVSVPLITLAGPSPVGRQGLSLLTNLELSELAAQDVDEYVDLAASLAQDVQRLAELRATIRPRFEASPVMNPRRLARHVEAGYRMAWERWCEGLPPEHLHVSPL